MPKVSVILPVYNAEKYLKEAIDSILSQTFTDFELLLINDGSTDDSEKIIQSYRDNRVVCLSNSVNKGLIYSLNRAIDLAKGEYIARMDADDIAMPERLKKQVEYLDTHLDVGVVATTIHFINDVGEFTGTWILDKNSITPESIRQAMTKNCCIAHPTVMGRGKLFRKFRYSEDQEEIEDYDLWLRMLNNKIKISKISETQLFYRIHSKSITQLAKETLIPQKRILDCKLKYLTKSLTQKQFSVFNVKIFLSAIWDLMVIAKKILLN